MDIIEEILEDIENKSSKFKTNHRKLIKALNKNYEGLKMYDPFNYLDWLFAINTKYIIYYYKN